MKKAAIYHFTDKSALRPKIYRDQVKALKAFTKSLGFGDADVFCDMSLLRCEQHEYDRFLSLSNQYDVLVAKDYYHISKNTGKCMKILQDLKKQGVKVYTIENGTFSWNDDPPFREPLRVATYTCHYGTQDEIKNIISLKNDICRLFIDCKTRWNLVDQFYDRRLKWRDGEQVQMAELINHRNDYELLLVHTLNDIHWRTAKFYRIWELLALDIYSLQEGFLKYDTNRWGKHNDNGREYQSQAYQ